MIHKKFRLEWTAQLWVPLFFHQSSGRSYKESFIIAKYFRAVSLAKKNLIKSDFFHRPGAGYK